jgi:excinuclease UvrABC helicase subunit UvrB
MDNINMNEEQYRALYNKIKTDLYNEFINPETATYGLDVIRQQEAKDNKPDIAYFNVPLEQQIIWDEIKQLEVVMKKYEDDEEYEKAGFIKKRIENLKKQL